MRDACSTTADNYLSSVNTLVTDIARECSTRWVFLAVPIPPVDVLGQSQVVFVVVLSIQLVDESDIPLLTHVLVQTPHEFLVSASVVDGYHRTNRWHDR